MAHVEPTDDQLQMAFARARKADWPERLADALAHPLYRRLVHMIATVYADGGDPFAEQRVHHRPMVIAPEPPHPADVSAPRSRPQHQAKPRRATPPPSSQLPFVDRKRAAGGDDD